MILDQNTEMLLTKYKLTTKTSYPHQVEVSNNSWVFANALITGNLPCIDHGPVQVMDTGSI